MTICALCSSPSDQEFCCPGCRAVYQILERKSELEGFQDHPLFRQAVKSGLISNCELQIDKSLPGELQKIYLEIGEMWCPSCAEIIRLVLLQEKGVKACAVDYTTDLASIEFAPQYISKQRLLELISSLGYKPSDLHDHKAISFSFYLRFIVAAFCSLNVMMFAYPLYAAYFQGNEHEYGHLFAWASFFLSIPVVFYCATPILQRFYNGLKLGIFGMEMLVVIGVASALLLSVVELWRGGTHVYFDSMTVIVAFVLLGKIVEAKAKFSTKDALVRLSLALPRRGRKRFADGSAAFVPMKEIAQDDLVVVMSGEKIVLDGIVIDGEGACDESLMTGESLPVGKKVDDLVIGGTFLQNGYLVYRVTHHPEETALQKILNVVGQDIGHKSTYLRAVDPIVRWFVPFVFLLAIIVGYCTDFERGIAILLISCPCAIGIAVPLAEAGMINGMASLGAIVRNRGVLSYMGRETCFIFDKTGTLTEGRFSVRGGLGGDLGVLKGMTALSSHLVSSAIHRAIRAEAKAVDQFQEIPGQGLSAYFAGERYLLGSVELLRSNGIAMPLSDQPFTYVGFAKGSSLLSVLSLGDVVKEDAKAAIAEINVPTILLSGDGREAVEKVAELCGLDEWHASHSPLLKREFVENKKRQGHIVAMVGDGINDAAALTSAHIGISVVSAADISIQISDLLLTTDSLCVIPRLFEIARKGRRIIKQNLFWAFFYNLIGMGLAVFGWLTPLFSAIAMTLSSLFVIFNAKRLRIR